MSVIQYIRSVFTGKKAKPTFTAEQIARFQDACCWDGSSVFMK